jgi:hypothetical protein
MCGRFAAKTTWHDDTKNPERRRGFSNVRYLSEPSWMMLGGSDPATLFLKALLKFFVF